MTYIKLEDAVKAVQDNLAFSVKAHIIAALRALPVSDGVTDEMCLHAGNVFHDALTAGKSAPEAMRAALEAALGATVSDGWEDIATAPRDGSEFLSAGGINGRAGTSYATRWLSPGPYSTENGKNTEGERRYQYPDGFYWAGYDGFVGPVDPTIWRPLPAPPS